LRLGVKNVVMIQRSQDNEAVRIYTYIIRLCEILGCNITYTGCTA